MEKDIYSEFDALQVSCDEAQQKVAHARTAIGRKIAGMRLGSRQRAITALMEEADTHEFLAIKTEQMMNGSNPVLRTNIEA
jgi:hypothetical protein